MRIELVEVGIARQHQHVRPDTAALGGDPVLTALLSITQGFALFKDAPARALDGRGQAQGQFQWVEVPAFGVIEPRLIAVAGDPLGQLVARDELQPIVAPLVTGLMLPLGE
ncbi:hypothetical protein D3C80_1506750 [compost metagenome]